jgi:hypothetical protein
MCEVIMNNTYINWLNEHLKNKTLFGEAITTVPGKGNVYVPTSSKPTGSTGVTSKPSTSVKSKPKKPKPKPKDENIIVVNPTESSDKKTKFADATTKGSRSTGISKTGQAHVSGESRSSIKRVEESILQILKEE